MRKKGLDAILLSHSLSVRACTGFCSSHAYVLLLSTHIFFFTDARYLEGAREFFAHDDSVEVGDIPKQWKSIFSRHAVVRLGVEKARVSAECFEVWQREWGVSLHNISDDLALVLAQKTDEELSYAKKAAAIADAALKRVLPLLAPGVTEQKYAWELEKAGRELGAEAVSFSPIVAFGEHSAIPHHSPTSRVLQKNEAVLIDWGFSFRGMCSDCTRCFFVGDKLDSDWEKLYCTVLEGQRAGRECIKVNKKIAQVQLVAEEKMGRRIPHSFGHGVGYEVHEYPTVSAKAEDRRFLSNMLLTAEPGIYLPGKYGIRIEDMGRVTNDGYEIFTRFPKEEYFLRR